MKSPFDPAEAIIYNKDIFLSFHPNGISFEVSTAGGKSFRETYYSIGGGFIVKEGSPMRTGRKTIFPYPIDTSADVLKWTGMTGFSVSEIVYRNEISIRPAGKVDHHIRKIWDVMQTCVYLGCHTSGFLPGGLNVKRRAFEINRKLLPEDKSREVKEWAQQIRSEKYGFSEILKWVSCFALAVNEENAAFGRVVTAPTNGAAGVIPAVLLYLLCFSEFSSFDVVKKIHPGGW
jgi:L-serine dehydratase